MSDLLVIFEGAEALSFFGEITPKVENAMQLAINKTATRARTESARKIREQIAFPATYLNPSQGRLKVSERASKKSLQATISARSRPTSLARFLTGPAAKAAGKMKDGQKNVKGPVTVEVKPGRKHNFRRAWVISLPGSPESRNLGIAVRTNGGPPPGAWKPKPLRNFGPNVWLVYGPSVAQALYTTRSRGGVATEIEGETLDFLANEFDRLMDLEIKK